MHFLVLAALHLQQCLVQLQQRFAQGHQLLARRSVSPIALVCVRAFIFTHRLSPPNSSALHSRGAVTSSLSPSNRQVDCSSRPRHWPPIRPERWHGSCLLRFPPGPPAPHFPS